jgi:hypothetical protein
MTQTTIHCFNRESVMPRPPSDITGTQIQIAVRVTQALKNEFQSMGGAIWLRKLLADSIEQRKKRESDFDKKK